MMLQTNPIKRPSCDDILKSEYVAKRLNSVVKDNPYSEKEVPAQLLATIKLPRNISEINQRLPKKKMYLQEK